MPPVDQIKTLIPIHIHFYPKNSNIHPTVQSRRPIFSFKGYVICFRLKAKWNTLPASPHPHLGVFPQTLYFYYVSMYNYQPEPVKWILVRPFASLAPTHSHWIQVLNVYMYSTCNATHTALCLGLYLSAFLKLHADFPNRGGMCSPKLGPTSAVCVATLLVSHSPDLIPRGC